MNRQSFFAKVNGFWLRHQPWFNFLATFSLLAISTVLAVDFMRAWSTQLDKMPYWPFAMTGIGLLFITFALILGKALTKTVKAE